MTPAQISKLPIGTHPFSQHPGLRLEVRASKKTWTLRRRDTEGKLKQQVLGHYPALSLAGAMSAAEVARRTSPALPAVMLREKTVRELVQAYCIDHIRTHRKDWKHSEGLIWRHVTGSLAEMAGGSVTRADAYALLSSVADRPAIQRLLKMELSATWEHCMGCGLLAEGLNPWAKQKVAPAGRRDRVLSDAEVTALVAWLREGGLTDLARDVLLVTLGTGARSGEVVGMLWDDVDLERGEWHLPTTKNGLPRIVYLNAFVVGVLKGRQRTHGDAAGERTHGDAVRVFETKLQQVISKAVNRHMGECPVKDWSPHVLRKTMRTGLARLGVSHEVAELCLGHRLGGVAGVYNLYQYGKEQKEALRLWGEKLVGLSRSC